MSEIHVDNWICLADSGEVSQSSDKRVLSNMKCSNVFVLAAFQIFETRVPSVERSAIEVRSTRRELSDRK